MPGISDYTGEFLPHLMLDDFSHEKLAGLTRLYSRLYMALDGFWYLSLKNRAGNDEALACDLAAWEKLCRYEMRYITDFLDIKERDVPALMKAIQLTPWFQNNDFSIDLRDGSALLTVSRCPTLLALEKEGEGREAQICRIVEPVMFKSYASFFNPGIKITCLMSPPRRVKSEVSCQWEFRMPESTP